jgi:thioredoxin reductase (NADPH)
MLAFVASPGASRPVALQAPSREAPGENIPSLINAPVFKQRFPEEATSILTQGGSDQSGVKGVSLKDTKTSDCLNLDTEGVFIFVGFSPNNQLVPAGVKINNVGYVITDEKCETTIPGIFAIGDLRQKYVNQIFLAAADGCTAALAAAHFVETRK